VCAGNCTFVLALRESSILEFCERIFSALIPDQSRVPDHSDHGYVLMAMWPLSMWPGDRGASTSLCSARRRKRVTATPAMPVREGVLSNRSGRPGSNRRHPAWELNFQRKVAETKARVFGQNRYIKRNIGCALVLTCLLTYVRSSDPSASEVAPMGPNGRYLAVRASCERAKFGPSECGICAKFGDLAS
jgi:hypothetical protein